MACRAGLRQSFAKAQGLLAELAGWAAADEAVRRLCHAAAARGQAWAAAEAPAAARFAPAAGAAAVPRAAGEGNTASGWRDGKVASSAQRPAGPPAAAAPWDERDLPAPAARRVPAASEAAAAFGPRCRAEAQRRGLSAPRPLSVLGDGARWLWGLAEAQSPGARQCLDIYPAAEHRAGAAQGVFGEGTAQARAQGERGRDRLLQDGSWGAGSGQIPAGGDGAALGAALNYFAGHPGRLTCAARLRRGEASGSGLVEGSIKQPLNRRLKQTGARWKVGQVGPFVELWGLADSPEWHAFWSTH
jgi:peptidoglycan hydrolase-like protein with peptidoglycan-binding domain